MTVRTLRFGDKGSRAPGSMPYEAMVDGCISLYKRLLSDREIALRIRNQLRFLRAPNYGGSYSTRQGLGILLAPGVARDRTRRAEPDLAVPSRQKKGQTGGGSSAWTKGQGKVTGTCALRRCLASATRLTRARSLPPRCTESATDSVR